MLRQKKRRGNDEHMTWELPSCLKIPDCGDPLGNVVCYDIDKYIDIYDVYVYIYTHTYNM